MPETEAPEVAEAPPRDTLVEFNVPMEGPRTADAPKGVSIRPGDRQHVTADQAERLASRGMAHLVGDDGQTVHHTTPEHGRTVKPETRPATPPVERAVKVGGKGAASGK